jgi:hypothetical protein
MTLRSKGTGSQDAYVVGISLHSGGQAMILYSGLREQRTLRVVRIGINASRC